MSCVGPTQAAPRKPKTHRFYSQNTQVLIRSLGKVMPSFLVIMKLKSGSEKKEKNKRPKINIRKRRLRALGEERELR